MMDKTKAHETLRKVRYNMLLADVDVGRHIEAIRDSREIECAIGEKDDRIEELQQQVEFWRDYGRKWRTHSQEMYELALVNAGFADHYYNEWARAISLCESLERLAEKALGAAKEANKGRQEAIDAGVKLVELTKHLTARLLAVELILNVVTKHTHDHNRRW